MNSEFRDQREDITFRVSLGQTKFHSSGYAVTITGPGNLQITETHQELAEAIYRVFVRIGAVVLISANVFGEAAKICDTLFPVVPMDEEHNIWDGPGCERLIFGKGIVRGAKLCADTLRNEVNTDGETDNDNTELLQTGNKT